MKKKLIAIFLCVALVAVGIVGATLAYFTDTDKATNTFAVGNVDIKIEEDFDSDTAKLVPGKDINKDVYVRNTGSENAFVRVHIAIPTSVDDGNPSFNASRNFLHFNFTKASVADGQWSWLPTYSTGIGYKGNGAGNWNFYTTEIEGVDYNVYVVTYRSELAANAKTTTQALDKVYLDKSVDATANADNTITYTDTKGNTVTMGANDNLKIIVAAEACQTETFTNAYEALNTAFGNPSDTTKDYTDPWGVAHPATPTT